MKNSDRTEINALKATNNHGHLVHDLS